MKQIIVVTGLIFLGVAISGMILGDSPDTLQGAAAGFMEKQIEIMSD